MGGFGGRQIFHAVMYHMIEALGEEMGAKERMIEASGVWFLTVIKLTSLVVSLIGVELSQ